MKPRARGSPRTPAAKQNGLEARRHEEKEFVRLHDTGKSSVWYIVDINWLEAWRRFIQGRSEPPGLIDNSRLVSREELTPVKDYRGVNSAVWMFWHQRYGGGPVVRRRTLDLYSQPVKDQPEESTGDLFAPPPTPAELCEPDSASRLSAQNVGNNPLSDSHDLIDGGTEPSNPSGMEARFEDCLGCGREATSVTPGQLVLAEYEGGWYLAHVLHVRDETCDVAWLRPQAEDWGCKQTMSRYLCSTDADETLHWNGVPIATRIRIPEESSKRC